MASLFVIQGADQGKRFEFTSSPRGSGPGQLERRPGSTIPRFPGAMPSSGATATAIAIVDLRSANGTFVNGKPVDQIACCIPATGSSLARRSCSFTRGTWPRAAT